MQRIVTEVDPCADPGWDERVRTLPGASIFHSSAWVRTLMDTYGYRPIYTLVQDVEGIVAIIPLLLIDRVVTGRRAVGLPFSDCCEPLACSDAAFHHAWGRLLEQGDEAGWKYIELRGGSRYLPDCVAFQVFDGHVLSLAKSLAELHSQLRPAVRRNLKRSRRETVAVERSVTIETLREFYRLHCLTRKRHGLPVQPWRFFRSLHRHVLAPGLGQVFLARHRGEAIAAAVYLHFANRAVYKYGASDYRYQSKRGNDAVMWQAICWYRENGFESLDFGRTGVDNSGLRRYKAGWGAIRSSRVYYRYRLDQARYVAGDSNEFHSYNRVLSKLPVTALRMIGEVLYGHMG